MVLLVVVLLVTAAGGAALLRDPGSSPPAGPAPTAEEQRKIGPVKTLQVTPSRADPQPAHPTVPIKETTELQPSTLDLPPSPSATLTPFRLYTAPVIGGADKLAFIEAGEIWAVNLDGSGLVQLTDDGVEKRNLQWAPDGLAVHFIAGRCVHAARLDLGEVEPIACLDTARFLRAFEISPDGRRVAISLDQALYVLPYDPEALREARSEADLQALAECAALAPYRINGRTVAVKLIHWSRNGKRLAIVREGLASDATGGRLVDLVQILDLSRCRMDIPRLDEFPSQRFEMLGYQSHPTLQDFAWDGDQLFALFDNQRNGGFGDLWIYSTGLHRGEAINPIAGACCYRDPEWSPDGRYLLFAFQDKGLAPAGPIRLYLVPLATVGTGLAYAPLPLPDSFLADLHARPQPVLRAVK